MEIKTNQAVGRLAVVNVSARHAQGQEQPADDITEHVDLEALEGLALALATVARLRVSEADQPIRSNLPGDDQSACVVRLEVLSDDAQKVATLVKQSLAIHRPPARW